MSLESFNVAPKNWLPVGQSLLSQHDEDFLPKHHYPDDFKPELREYGCIAEMSGGKVTRVVRRLFVNLDEQ